MNPFFCSNRKNIPAFLELVSEFSGLARNVISYRFPIPTHGILGSFFCSNVFSVQTGKNIAGPPGWGAEKYTGNDEIPYEICRFLTFLIILGAAGGGGLAGCEQKKTLLGCMHIST